MKFLVKYLQKVSQLTIILLCMKISHTYAFDIKQTEMLANQGDVDAQFSLAIYYGNNHQIEKSVFWHEKAAEKNNVKSMYSLGCIYLFNFTNVGVHLDKAFYWFSTAAELNYPEAQTMLGNAYSPSGFLSEDNHEKMMYWYTKAAEQGEVFAQLNLGIVEESQSNYKTALKWYNKLCKNGFQEGCNLSKKLATKMKK